MARSVFYRPAGATDWQRASGDVPISVTGLAAGTYDVDVGDGVITQHVVTEADPYAAYSGPNGETPTLILDFDNGVYAADTGSGLAAVDHTSFITGFSSITDLGDGILRMATGAGISPTVSTSAFTFDATQGTVAVRFRFSAVPDYAPPVYINNGSTGNRIGTWKNPDASWRYVVRDGGTYQVALDGALHVADTAERQAFAWQANSFGASINGTAALNDAAGTVPAVTRMDLANDRGAAQSTGGIERVVYYPTRIADADLVTMAGADGPSTYTLTGDQGYTQFRLQDSVYEVLDASTATILVNNDGVDPNHNPYPLLVQGAVVSSMTILGGTALGEVDPTKSWEEGYNQTADPNGNSAAITVQNCPVTVSGWTFGSDSADAHGWDLIRIEDASDGSIVENCRAFGWRDDFIEADNLAGDLLIRNTLWDGGFGGISCTSQNLSHAAHTITVEDTLFRLTDRWLYDGEPMHGPVFKVDSSGTGQPSWVVNNCVVAIESPLYVGATSRTPEAFSRMTGTGNKWLCMGFTQDPSHPALPAGWTLYEGQAAIDEWEAVKAAWLAANP